MDRRELYTRAQAVVERRRQQVETQAARQREALFAAVPRLWEIEQEQGTAGALAARLSALGQRGAAANKLAEVDGLEEEKQALLQNMGTDAQALKTQYHCALCHDTGKHKGRACRCVREEMKRLRREAVNGSGPLRLCRFENFELGRYPEKMPLDVGSVYPRAEMEAILNDCRHWAAQFGPRSQSLYMFGDAGLGKTHLALSIASEVLEKGYDVIYVSAQSAFSHIGNFDDREAGEALFVSMLEADLLILDDLGTEYTTPFILAKLYELVNGRMGRPTIYTTNICRQNVLEMRYDEKIISRLLGESHCMRFWGEDIRLQNK